MAPTNTEAARGTAVLVFSQSCYFILGYFAVVFLAREFGPAAYGAYGVIMSVLVWLEESGRSAIPFATAKLVAETTADSAALERTAVILNLALYTMLFVLLWLLAPGLSSWFGIADGALLFRIAAIDLPFFGAYTAFRAIHQGYRHFFQLGCSQVIYALTKLVGFLFIIRFGVSVESALLVNVAATIIGLACLFPGIGPGRLFAGSGLRWQGRWLKEVKPLAFAAMPMGTYYFVLGLRGELILWTLQAMSPGAESAVIGVFVAAFNIARAPSMILTTVTTVILPSLSRALAVSGDARSPSLPNVPTMTEAGQPKYKAVGWFGLMAPAGTAAGIVAKLSDAVADAARSPEVTTGLRVQGIEPASSSPQQFAVFIREQLELHKQLVADVDLKLSQ